MNSYANGHPQRAQRDFFYKSPKYDITIDDLGSMSRSELLLVYADVVRQISSLNDQIGAAILKHTNTGEKSDPEWFRRVKSKRAIVVGFYSHLCSALALSKKAGLGAESVDHLTVRRTRKRSSTYANQENGTLDPLATALATQILNRFSSEQIAQLLAETRES